MGDKSPAGQMRLDTSDDMRSLAALLDPVALEARLRVARAKRAEALARGPAGPHRAAVPPMRGGPAGMSEAQCGFAPQPAPAPPPAWSDEARDIGPPPITIADVAPPGAAAQAPRPWARPAAATILAFATGAGVTLALALLAPGFFADFFGGSPKPAAERVAAAEPPAVAPAPAGLAAVAAPSANPPASATPVPGQQTISLPASASDTLPPAILEPSPAAPSLATAALEPPADPVPPPSLATAALEPPADPVPAPAADTAPGEPRLDVAALRPMARPGPLDAAAQAVVAPLPPAPPGAVGTDGVAVADPGAPPATAAVGAPSRLVVHAPRGAPEAAAGSAVDALAAAGLEPTGVVRVGFGISRSNVRYYHPEDAERAAAVAAALPADLGAVETRDFTDYSPKPVPGTVEVWIAGESGGGPVRASPQAPRAPGLSDEIRRLVDTVAEQQRQASEDVARGARGLGEQADKAARRVESALGEAFRAISGAP